MKLLHIAYFLLLLAFSAQPVAQNYIPSKTIRIATYPDYEPFCFFQEQANKDIYTEVIAPNASSKIFTGLAWQVVLKSFQLQGYQVELFIVPWPRAYSMLEINEVDAIFPAIKTPLREAQFSFSQQTVYPPNPLVFYQARDTKNTLNKSFSNLYQLKSGTIRGFSYGKEWDSLILKQSLDPILVTNLKQGFKMLAANRFDVLPGYQLAHDYYLRTHGLEDLFKISQPFDIAYSYLMFGSKDSIHLKNFNQGRKELQDSGHYQKLRSNWKMQ